ncbi:AAA family ATPase [Frankia sp. AgKG'84/4]|uniref:AAA family ATPase n=1 Tax=Frankia sp. AgKG'84/4 TaxID=573490 RepID=UPI00200F95F3|nr:DUF3696 domain-containing protein [Frankia sp. AgKG'84/4]MCL9794282.1 DUF3696 domain-containing protein [Frankia sp. AgKG'84/4]
MSLVALTVERYKCFDRGQTLELRPVTVLLGRNNSGKSALARLPALLETGLRTGSPAPLEPDALDFEIAGGFTDLIFGQRPHGKVTFGLHFDTAELGAFEIKAGIQNIDEVQLQVVSDFHLTVPGRDLDISWTWNIDDPRNPTWRFTGPEPWGPVMSDVAFRGILPRPRDSLNGHLWLSYLEEVRQLYPSIRYVGPFRERPARYYRMPTRSPQVAGVLGEKAPLILADDVARGNGHLLAAVNDYLRQELPGWSLAVDQRSNLFSLVLTSNADPGVQVNLADTGTGVAQVLPILVQRTIDSLSSGRSRPVLEVVEQPELHLHPAAHAALADLYLAGSADNRCRFLIETHSETFVLRLRRRVAQGKISPDQIALYYVEHNGQSADLHRIELDDLGNVANWPDGVFSEDYQEVRALAAAQNERT